MTKSDALKHVSRMAEERADAVGILKTPRAADFYDVLAIALQGDCQEDADRAAELAAMVREVERHQLKFRELLRS